MIQNWDIRSTRRSIIISFEERVTQSEVDKVKKRITGFDDLMLTIKTLASFGYNEDTGPIVKEALSLYDDAA